jgi:hypothetical protein
MINSILSTDFLFSPTYFPFSIMPKHFTCSMINSRCEKEEVGEKWSERVAGRWVRSQKFMDANFFSVHDQLLSYHPFLIFSTPFAYVYDANPFTFLHN